MRYFRLTLILVYILQQAACSPMAVMGMVGSTVVRSVANADENYTPSPAGVTRSSQSYDRQAIAEANLNLGIAYMQQGQYQLALDKLNRARIAQPSYAPTYNTLGVLYQRMGENAEAEKYYQHAIKLDPMDYVAYYNRGLARKELGLDKEADQDFEQAKRLEQK